MDDDLTSRLRSLGDEPVPPATSAAHLIAMSSVGVSAARAPRRFGRAAVGLAALTGFLVGGSGLAMAGALPGPAQGAAADVLAQVGVEAPGGTEHRNRGACVSAIAKTQGVDEPGGGEVRDEAAATAERDAAKAAKDACPKGGRSRVAKPAKDDRPCTGAPVEGEDCERDGGRSGDPGGPAGTAGCDGPPPWAGGGMTKAEKDVAKAARTATCGPDEDAAAEEAEERAEVEEDRDKAAPADESDAVGDAVGRPDGAGKPEVTGKPEGAGQPGGEGKPEGTGKPGGEGKPEGTGKPGGEGKPEGAGKPEGDGATGSGGADDTGGSADGTGEGLETEAQTETETET